MISLLDFWLPTLLSAVAVFFASFVAWMILPHHKPDWTAVPREQDFLESLHSMKTPPGQYMFPFCTNRSQRRNREKQKAYEAGPHGVLAVWRRASAMGRKIAATALFFGVVSIFVAHLARQALDPGEAFLKQGVPVHLDGRGGGALFGDGASRDLVRPKPSQRGDGYA